MKINKALLALLLGSMLLLAALSSAFGGGPLILFSPGTPYKYDTSTPVVYNLDLGNFGPLTNAEADFLAVASFAAWQAVPTAAITFMQGADLPVDVVLANAGTFLGNAGVGDGRSPVVYDTDGSIIANFFGAGPGVLGISGPVAAMPGTNILTESFSIFRGTAIDPADVINTPPGKIFGGVFTHEHGHFINLAHTVVNGQALFLGDATLPDGTDLFVLGLGLEHMETMYPFIDVSPPGTTGEFQALPDPDDAAILSTIYPDTLFLSTTGTITGTVFAKDGVTGLTGVQVIARNTANMLGDAVSAISGDFTQGDGPLGINDGTFTINGLTPGATYLLYIIDTIAGGFSTPVFVARGGTAVPSLGRLPGPEEFYNGATESFDPLIDDPAEFSNILVAAGSPVVANMMMNSAVIPLPADALIWLPAGVSTISETPIEDALTANGKTWSITADLTLAMPSNYKYLFATLGMFPNNYIIATGSPEAMMIESFLAVGVKVYMEGGDVWFWDPRFNGGHDFGPDFGIKAIEDGSSDLTSLLGGPCLQGMDFTYSGDNQHVDHIDSTNQSFVFHSNTSPRYNCGIGYDFNAGLYRTIGASFLFGALNDFSISFFSKNDLMLAYLDFFDNGCATGPQPCTLPLIAPTDAEGNTGDEIIIDINVEQNPNAIDAFGLKLIFDPAALTYQSTEAGNLTAGFQVLSGNLSKPSEVTIGGFGTSPVPGNSTGSLAKVKFTVACQACPSGFTSQLSLRDLVDDVQSLNPCTATFTYSLPGEFDIAGRATYCPSGGPVRETVLILSGGVADSVATDTNGNYRFDNLISGNYTATPSKANDVGLLSITCFDAALAARIAVGLDAADHCDSVAADVDEDGNIFTFDAALICRYAVGLPAFGPNDQTGEWRFEPESRSYASLDSNRTAQDYVAALLGDVDGNWTPALNASALVKEEAQRITFVEQAEWSPDQKEVTTRLSFAGGISALAFELDLRYEANALQFVEAACPLEGWTIVRNNTEDGRLRLGMYSTAPLVEAAEIVHIKWQALNANEPAKIRLEHSQVNRETQSAVELEVTLQKRLPAEFALHQNYPNPFNPETIIAYGLPKAEHVTLKIYNVFGQSVKTLFQGRQEAGYYKLIWNGADDRGHLAPSGVYFYRIEAGAYSKTRKLAVVR